MNKVIWNSVLFLWMILVACAAHKNFDEMVGDLYQYSIPLMKAQQLSFEMERDTSMILLDAREMEEYQVSHIKGAHYIGYKTIDMSALKEVDKTQKIVIYCSVGYRSERIGEQLKEQGYHNIYNLYGGMFDWVNEGYEVYDKEEQTTSKVHAYSKSWGKWLTKGEKIYE